ncbi:Hypothetical predicted protein [Paramuricea clavata]|uniref:Uncharacterized protein n=1 Tax=Paramuricea clavata TaxID=317549 RepID=A0A6S7JFY1_PARCT|nr:Hypothetical predicted protein [Paramuricea clavata]
MTDGAQQSNGGKKSPQQLRDIGSEILLEMSNIVLELTIRLALCQSVTLWSKVSKMVNFRNVNTVTQTVVVVGCKVVAKLVAMLLQSCSVICETECPQSLRPAAFNVTVSMVTSTNKPENQNLQQEAWLFLEQNFENLDKF